MGEVSRVCSARYILWMENKHLKYVNAKNSTFISVLNIFFDILLGWEVCCEQNFTGNTFFII